MTTSIPPGNGNADERGGSASPDSRAQVQLSVILPCLNEVETVPTCVLAAIAALERLSLTWEVVVADNGSTDGSVEAATAAGARVVAVPRRGYGAAIMGGIEGAHGRWLLIADADASYDLSEIPAFVAALQGGAELVQGCRLRAGGGRVMPGAMPFLHKWIGNPGFTALARWWFHTPIHDVHCGMRALTRELYVKLRQQCTGMEFASEMIIKAALLRAPTAEVPITLHPDGRTAHPRHLRTFRDGWRHLRFYLIFSPRWLFLIPGVILILGGFLGYAIALPRSVVAGVTFDVHTLLFASLAVICGFQAILFAILAKLFAITEGLLPEDWRLTKVGTTVTLERGILWSVGAIALGGTLLGIVVNEWRLTGFGELDYSKTMRLVIPGSMFTTLGIQALLCSFFASLIALKRRSS